MVYMVLVSIITPVFNNVEYIEKCIQNVISQKCTSIEHLIVDGGSSDGTVDVIKKYADEYPHISWLSKKDSGQSEAMNKGINLAKGKYISFLNVDDYYSENTLNEIAELVTKDDSLKFIVGDCNVWNDKNELVYINRPSKGKPWHILSGYYFPVNPTAYFYEKSIHEQTGPYNVDNHYNMDLEFLIKSSLVTEMKYYNRIWGNFRLLPDTKTGSDQQNGLLEQRKTELFQRYLKKVSLKIKGLAFGVRNYEFTKRKLIKIKKKLIAPLDAVYWKIKKIVTHK